MIVAAQITVPLLIQLVPSLWVMIRELGFVPHLGGAGRADYASLLHISFYVFLIQLSIVLGDKIDTTVLGYALSDTDPGPSITVYQNVSKPFMQIRQTGWTLAHLVLPVVASLAAARDESSLERIKYDGPRLLIGVLLPLALLAGIYAGPFLSLWVGPHYAPYAPMLQLFLVATLPLMLWVHAQMAIGMGRAELARAPPAGRVAGEPAAELFSDGPTGRLRGDLGNGTDDPVFKLAGTGRLALPIAPGPTLELPVPDAQRPLLGAVLLIAATWVCRALLSPDPSGTTLATRSLPLVIHLTLGTLAYLAGYLAAPVGRADLAALARVHRR